MSLGDLGKTIYGWTASQAYTKSLFKECFQGHFCLLCLVQLLF